MENISDAMILSLYSLATVCTSSNKHFPNQLTHLEPTHQSLSSRIQFAELLVISQLLRKRGFLTVLAARGRGAQDRPAFSAVEGVAIAVQGVMESSEVPGTNITLLQCPLQL